MVNGSVIIQAASAAATQVLPVVNTAIILYWGVFGLATLVAMSAVYMPMVRHSIIIMVEAMRLGLIALSTPSKSFGIEIGKEIKEQKLQDCFAGIAGSAIALQERREYNIQRLKNGLRKVGSFGMQILVGMKDCLAAILIDLPKFVMNQVSSAFKASITAAKEWMAKRKELKAIQADADNDPEIIAARAEIKAEIEANKGPSLLEKMQSKLSAIVDGIWWWIELRKEAKEQKSTGDETGEEADTDIVKYLRMLVEGQKEMLVEMRAIREELAHIAPQPVPVEAVTVEAELVQEEEDVIPLGDYSLLEEGTQRQMIQYILSFLKLKKEEAEEKIIDIEAASISVVKQITDGGAVRMLTIDMIESMKWNKLQSLAKAASIQYIKSEGKAGLKLRLIKSIDNIQEAYAEIAA